MLLLVNCPIILLRSSISEKKSVKHGVSQYFQLGALFSLCSVKCLLSPAPSGAAAMPASSLGTFLGVVKLTVFKAL